MISLGRSFGHPGRMNGDPLHHPDGEAFGELRDVGPVVQRQLKFPGLPQNLWVKPSSIAA